MWAVNVSPATVFAINFIAIIPLTALVSCAGEEIAIRVGQTLIGLLNATFGFVACNTLRYFYLLTSMQKSLDDNDIDKH